MTELLLENCKANLFTQNLRRENWVRQVVGKKQKHYAFAHSIYIYTYIHDCSIICFQLVFYYFDYNQPKSS